MLLSKHQHKLCDSESSSIKSIVVFSVFKFLVCCFLIFGIIIEISSAFVTNSVCRIISAKRDIQVTHVFSRLQLF